MEAFSSSVEQHDPDHDEGPKDNNTKHFHLFNCDRTYNLDLVEKLLKSIETKIGFVISPVHCYFDLWKMSETCDRINSQPQMDFAIFVVHAHESHLSINEDNAGIGYAKIYRALLQRTDERVIVVIGGDDNYKNAAEEHSSVLSRWAYRMVSSQFDEKFLDGRKSFIFSWDQRHRPIHEEAMLHFLDPGKVEEKFVHKPPPVQAPQLDLKEPIKSHESSTTEVIADTYRNLTDFKQPICDELSTQARHEEEKSSLPHEDSPEPNEKQPESFVRLSSPQEKQGKEEDMEKSFIHVTLKDVAMEDLVPARREGLPHQTPMDEDTPVLVKVAILYRDQSDIAHIKDVFGEDLLGLCPFWANDPAALRDILSANPVRTCIFVLEAGKIKDEIQMESKKVYSDLLSTARQSAEKKVVIILCNDNNQVWKDEEGGITAKIEERLGEKGMVLWWKRKPSLQQSKPPFLGRSLSIPSHGGEAKRSKTESVSVQAPPPINFEDHLLLETRLRRGEISYQREDVKRRQEEWTAPQNIADDLLTKHQSTIDAELRIYKNVRTGNHLIVLGKDEGS